MTLEVQFHKINFLPGKMMETLSVTYHINKVKKLESTCLIKLATYCPCKDTIKASLPLC